MRFCVPKWYLLALLYALLACTGRSATISTRLTARGDDSDDDDDSGDDSDGDGDGSQRHRAGSKGNGSSTLTEHRISGGAIAGIVIGVLLLLVLLIIGCWYLRRRRRARVERAAVLAAVASPSMKENSTAPLLVQHPANLQPRSPVTASPTDSIPRSILFVDSTGQRSTGTQELRNLAPDVLDTTPLPNPYDGDTPPQPPPRDELASPTSPVSPVSRYASLNSSSLYSSNRLSTAPSAWTHEGSGEALLSRGATHASRVSTSSSLHDELSGYQKRLEAHHRKEEEDAVRQQLGEGSRVPADPPPVYSPSEER
ncbi:hypothetical protein K466DRAFT_657644 [Polyporus arcularius HHB13444]|uniref:Mid2 domain-containing protein n=1 Tax=Polyporus arcularius HHB13444 TaxID=1314778 RepID=A0A5C3Q0I8_9APHY|nr:hypothetical protein K466DRAFT_657644 [Polyporus arcularius HHB13444]